MLRPFVLILALAVSSTAVAQVRTVSGRLFVERPSASGVRLSPAPNRLARGRTVVVLVDSDTAGPADVVSAIPAALRFDRADGGAELSVDGGRRFGALATLTTADGARRAQPADVTHIRWRIAPATRPPVLSFRGTVR